MFLNLSILTPPLPLVTPLKWGTLHHLGTTRVKSHRQNTYTHTKQGQQQIMIALIMATMGVIPPDNYMSQFIMLYSTYLSMIEGIEMVLVLDLDQPHNQSD